MVVYETVPAFSALADQKHALACLSGILETGKLPSGLLFTGIEGVGKEEAAILFAMAANCPAKGDNKEGAGIRFNTEGVKPLLKIVKKDRPGNLISNVPCYHCRSCRKIHANTHPDVISIHAGGSFIKIAQIRDLVSRLAFRPNEAQVRVVIINNAQTMNPEASNALLKILEEPPTRTIFILTATRPEALLSTVVSRCQQIRFHPLSRETIRQTITTSHSIDSKAADAIAGMSGGSLARAFDMASASWMARRNWLISMLEALPDMPLELQLAFAERLAREKKNLDQMFEVLKNWLRDRIIYSYKPDKIINSDLTDRITGADNNRRISGIIEKIEAIRSAQYKLSANTNVRLTMEILIMALAKI